MDSTEPKYLKRQVHSYKYLRSRIYFFFNFHKIFLLTTELEFSKPIFEWVNFDLEKF